MTEVRKVRFSFCPFELEPQVLGRHLSGGPLPSPVDPPASRLVSLGVSFSFLAALPSAINLFIPSCLVWISHALYAAVW